METKGTVVTCIEQSSSGQINIIWGHNPTAVAGSESFVAYGVHKDIMEDPLQHQTCVFDIRKVLIEINAISPPQFKHHPSYELNGSE
ncbi:hypothetical protein TURU_099506 [Turdus rufiventris]|nr:hypothetical protein TURU_099506 [Turdus rufiventris]